jgi:hypothetical protein
VKYLIAFCLIAAVAVVNARSQNKNDQNQNLLGLFCKMNPTEDDSGTPFRYKFEIDRQTSKGVWTVWNSSDPADPPLIVDIEVVFTPERMQFRKLGQHDFKGFIDRTDLHIDTGGYLGSCKRIPVKKKATKF